MKPELSNRERLDPRTRALNELRTGVISLPEFNKKLSLIFLMELWETGNFLELDHEEACRPACYCLFNFVVKTGREFLVNYYDLHYPEKGENHWEIDYRTADYDLSVWVYKQPLSVFPNEHRLQVYTDSANDPFSLFLFRQFLTPKEYIFWVENKASYE